MALLPLVARSRHVVDHAVSAWLLHALAAAAYSRHAPLSARFWLRAALCAALSAAVGRRLCVAAELRAAIPRRQRGRV